LVNGAKVVVSGVWDRANSNVSAEKIRIVLQAKNLTGTLTNISGTMLTVLPKNSSSSVMVDASAAHLARRHGSKAGLVELKTGDEVQVQGKQLSPATTIMATWVKDLSLTITTADQAAAALRPLAGDFAFLLFAAGIIGTGLLAVPILAGSASYALAETFNWKAGLGKKFNQAKAFYVIIIISTLVGVLINFTPIRPFQMLYYTAILNGICAPPLLILIMLISRNKKIMGQYTNSRLSNTMGWIIAVVMSLAAIALIITI
jgi:hypothetical protein